MNTMTQQRGFSFVGFVVVAVLLVFAVITGLKLIPAYMQYAQINNIFTAISIDPEMQKASLHDIRDSFNKRASIDNITVIKAEDIEIASDEGRPVLNASYSVKIPLGGNVSLLLEFNPTSAAK